MAEIVFQNSSIVLADSIAGVSAMSISEGNIVEVVFNENATALSTATDFDGVLIFAGSIDIHNHGAVGADVNEADANGLLKIASFLAKNGVTTWMPTLVPDSDEKSVERKMLATVPLTRAPWMAVLGFCILVSSLDVLDRILVDLPILEEHVV